MVSIRVATLRDADTLMLDIRDSDLEEIKASIPPYCQPVEAIKESIEASTVVYAAEADGNLLAIYGMVDHGSGAASLWMLGTTHLRHHRRALLRIPRRYIKNLMKSYTYLFNFVYSKNTTSIRWLQALGFTVFPEPEGGWPFRRFEMRR